MQVQYCSVWSSTLAVRAPACIRGKGGKGDFVGRCEIDPYVSSSCSSSSRTKLKLTNKLPLSLRATQGCHATQYMYMDASAAYADTSSDTDTSSQRVSADSTLNSTHMHTNHKSRRLPVQRRGIGEHGGRHSTGSVNLMTAGFELCVRALDVRSCSLLSGSVLLYRETSAILSVLSTLRYTRRAGPLSSHSQSLTVQRSVMRALSKVSYTAGPGKRANSLPSKHPSDGSVSGSRSGRESRGRRRSRVAMNMITKAEDGTRVRLSERAEREESRPPAQHAGRPRQAQVHHPTPATDQRPLPSARQQSEAPVRKPMARRRTRPYQRRT
jgi:hypothetical protein